MVTVKTTHMMLLLLLALALGSCAVQREVPAPRSVAASEPVADYQVFYDELSPYGTWVDYPNYGYVWMPEAGPGFTPYATAGRWVLTDDGWTWVSDYPWGWAAFHYGRWDYDSMYGWFWVPDNEWGPAWVSWRRAPGYYGWAPLRPGVSIDLALNAGYRERDDRWIFVRDVDITDPDIRHHYLDRRNTLIIINNSTVIINSHRDNRRRTIYIAGPERTDVERVTRTRVTPVVIREDTRPGHRLRGSELEIYRPQIEHRTPGAQRPARVMRLNDLRPEQDRNRGGREREAAPPVQNPTRTQPPVVAPPAQTTPPPRQRNTTPPAGTTQPSVTPPPVTPPMVNPQPATPPQDNTRRPPRQRNATPDQRNRQPGVNRQPEDRRTPQENAAPQKRTRSAPPPASKTREQDEKEKRQRERERE